MLDKNLAKTDSFFKYGEIPDEEKRVFILSGIAVFADKIIEKGSANEIRRLISMTKVGQLFEQEKEKYA